jgi:hypothetical protein
MTTEQAMSCIFAARHFGDDWKVYFGRAVLTGRDTTGISQGVIGLEKLGDDCVVSQSLLQQSKEAVRTASRCYIKAMEADKKTQESLNMAFQSLKALCVLAFQGPTEAVPEEAVLLFPEEHEVTEADVKLVREVVTKPRSDNPMSAFGW